MSRFVWLTERDVITMHQRLIMAHGGAEGLRDLGLLQSALARPHNVMAYEPDAEISRLAASLTAGIVRNHPFVDGNKRIGFVAGIMVLELNGARFTATEEVATHMVIALAGSTIDEVAYAEFLRENT